MNNTLDKEAYIREHITWSLVLFLICKALFFRCIPNCSYGQSLFALGLIMVCVSWIGIVLTWKWCRNYISVAENVVTTWGVYVIVAYADIYRERIVRFGLIAIGLSILVSIWIMARKIKRLERKKRIIRKRTRKIILIWRTNITAALLCLLVPLGISVTIYGTILNPKVKVAKVYGDEHSLAANIETISNIAPQKWCGITTQERLDVCQKIVNCEGRYLGISHEIRVGIAVLPASACGCYVEAKHQILINTEHLENSDSYDILNTLIHECTHAYQYEQVEVYKKLDQQSRNLLMFYDASVYMEEFADYEDGNEDFFRYYTQKAEMDARDAAERESKVYIRKVEEYLQE